MFAAFQTHNILVFMSGLSKISLGEKSDTERVKKFSWHTAQKVSIPKIQCEWPMQLLFAVFREETCTYSWAVAQQSLESFHSFGMKKYDEQSSYFCVSFMLFQVCLVVYLDLLLSTIKNKRKTTKKTKSSLRVWVS